jgi:hypothetical protein
MADEVATAHSPTLEDAPAQNGAAPARSAAPLPPPGRNTSIRPALLVVGIAVGLVVVFIVFSALAGNGNSGTKPSSSPEAVPGTSLKAVGAEMGLSPIIQGGEPPANIVNAIRVPAGSVRVSHLDNRGSQYDQQVTFSAPASQAAVFDFFRTEMHRTGWSVADAGPAANAPKNVEVLGKKAGNDGWYWEMGATVSPTTFGTTSAGPGTGSDSTRFTIRLYQVSDEAD